MAISPVHEIGSILSSSKMTNFYPVSPHDVPFITTEQMREVDRAMIEDFGVTLLQMMENAGRNLAEVVVQALLGNEAQGRRVVVAAGSGGNGGGGLAAARHLHNGGCDVVVVTTGDEERFSEAVRHQLNILRVIGVPVRTAVDETFDRANVIIDALFGYSLNGPPREPAASLIRMINDSGVPVVSNDIPTGVEATSGTVHYPAISAAATVTIALPKTGLRSPEARQLVGDLYLGDISVPPELYERSLGISVPSIFNAGPIVRMSSNE